MEELSKAFELVRTAWEYLKDKPVLKITVNIFAVSSAVFAFCSVPMVSSILGGMNETIRAIAFLTMLVSVLSISSTFLVNRIYAEVERRKTEKEQERAHESERSRIRWQIESLSESERRILSLVESGKGCGVWLAQEDAAVLTLLHKGLLKRVGNAERWQDWESGYNGSAWCILAELPSDVREEIGKLQS